MKEGDCASWSSCETVYSYRKVDLGIVRQILDEDLEDLRTFIREISARVS